LGGEDGEVIIIKTGDVYVWENDGWKQIVTTSTFFFLNLSRPCLYEVNLKCKEKFSCVCDRNVVLDCLTGKIYKRDDKKWIEICDIKTTPIPPIFAVITYTFNGKATLTPGNLPTFPPSGEGNIFNSNASGVIPWNNAINGTFNISNITLTGILLGRTGILKNFYVKFSNVEYSYSSGSDLNAYIALRKNGQTTYNRTSLIVDTGSINTSEPPVLQNLTSTVSVNSGDHILLVVYINGDDSPNVTANVSAQIELEYQV